MNEVDAAIILYFIPFLYMFAGVLKLAGRKDRTENPHAVLVPGGKLGLWASGILGFVVVLIGIFVSLVPPGEAVNKWSFELRLLGGTLVSILIGLVLYWRGARSCGGSICHSIARGGKPCSDQSRATGRGVLVWNNGTDRSSARVSAISSACCASPVRPAISAARAACK